MGWVAAMAAMAGLGLAGDLEVADEPRAQVLRAEVNHMIILDVFSSLAASKTPN